MISRSSPSRIGPSHPDREMLARQQRRILALELRGSHAPAARLRRLLIAKVKRRLTEEENPWLWLCLGDAYASPKCALQAYRAALRLEPRFVEALYALAEREFESKNAQAAENLLDRALALDIPGDLSSLIYDLAVRVYRQRGRQSDARRAMRNLRRAIAKHRESRVTLGETMPELFEGTSKLE